MDWDEKFVQRVRKTERSIEKVLRFSGTQREQGKVLYLIDTEVERRFIAHYREQTLGAA